MLLFRWITLQFLEQRLYLFPWMPVAFALGIGIYFSLPDEPGAITLWLCVCGGMTGVVLGRILSPDLVPLAWLVTLIFVGVLLGAGRVHLVKAPVIDGRYYGPIEGRVITIDRSGSDKPRLWLDQVVLLDLSPDQTPARVRVSLHGRDQGIVPQIGDIVQTTGHLSAPSGPAEPGGFDFRRHAWFQKIGGVGYTRLPVMRRAPAGQSMPVGRLRHRMSERVRAQLSGQTGAIAAALMTGDRAAVSLDTFEQLRRSNLAHLLAISGLHVGLLVGVTFAVLRAGISAVPVVALRVNAKKIAAFGALWVSFGYLLMSGRSISTERAFIMSAVFLIAVLVGQRALSIRAVAFAAVIVLGLRPESLLSPGFQMSFAATTCLIAFFEILRARHWHFKRWQAPLSVVFSSLIAGLATAPFSAAYFNQISQLGLIANLLSVPLMGAWVMPWGAMSVALMPFGAESLALWCMGWGIDWILGVAERISAFPLTIRHVKSPASSALPLLSFGALWVILWFGNGRWLGLLPICLALFLWGQAARPTVLIEENGRVVGLLGPAGRAISREKGAGFVVGIWLENDGSATQQAEAAVGWTKAVKSAALNIHVVRSKKEIAHLTCQPDDWVVSPYPITASLPCADRVFDIARLKETGSVALYHKADTVRVVTAREKAGDRLWMPTYQRTDQ